MLSAEKLVENWNQLQNYVNTYISSPRKEQVLKFLNEMEEYMAYAPASTREYYHNAFAGGYVDHVNRVIQLALVQTKVYAAAHGTVDFTEEELVMAALFHDLGKLGDGDEPGYLEQDDDWRRRKLREVYKHNSELQYMLAPDRSLFVLQKYGIQLTQKEFLAIRTHDGMFDEANKSYFVSYDPDAAFKTSIVYILHVADYLASKIEKDIWARNKPGKSSRKKSTKTKSTKGLTAAVKNL